MSRRIVFIVSVVLLLSGMTLMPPEDGVAGSLPPGLCNGDFETGDLQCWGGVGDVGVADFNVLSGTYSAYITTAPGGGEADPPPLSGTPAFNDMCSWLDSNEAFPEYVPTAVEVSFLVRYKSDQRYGGRYYEDPFDAKLVTLNGTVPMVTIETDGLTPGPFSTVIDTSTGLPLTPPTLPPFSGIDEPLYEWQTNTLQVSSTLSFTDCAPVWVKFSICDRVDDGVPSAAFIDDVVINFVYELPTWNPPGEGFGGGSPIPCDI